MASAFPVTLEHSGGQTTIDKLPERLATFGKQQTDAVLALGVAPVGIERTEYWISSAGEVSYGPWRADAIEALGGAIAPQYIDPVAHGSESSSKGVSIESLEPDLIVSNSAECCVDCSPSTVQGFYGSLDEIAPTLLPTAIALGDDESTSPSSVAWSEALLQAGSALGKSAEAQALLASIDDSIAGAVAAHPEFDGKTITLVAGYESGFGGRVLAPSSTFAALLEEFGISVSTTPEGIDPNDCELSGGVFMPSVELAELDVDALVTADDDSLVMDALMDATALSLPWALDAFVAQLADALE